MPPNPPARNAPCPCGSGKRYKDCHGALSPSTPLPPAVPVRSGQAPGAKGPEWIASVLQQALAHQSSDAAAEAEACYRQVLAAAPDHFDALHMLGLIRHQRGAHEEALDLIQRAIGQLATHAPAYSNLGLVLHALNRLPEAIAAFDQALALQPDFTEALSNRGNALHQQARYREAIESFHRALAFNPKQPTVLSNLGNALFELGQYDEAAQAFARLVSLVPEYDWAPGYLLNCRLHSCNWAGLDEVYGNIAAAIRAGTRAIVPFSLLAVSDSPAEQLACARICSAAHSRHRIAYSAAPPRANDGRIRLAYLSADFHEHATAYLMAELFETHDRNRFDVTAISFGPDQNSPMRHRLKRAFAEFVDVREFGDAQVAQMLRDRNVDIAVDLKGWTRGTRPGILARRPAPVQVNYLGYPGTLGADWIDYIIADAQVIPPGDELHYDEKVVRLPDTFFVNDRQRAMTPRVPGRTEVGLPENAFVFCCFNNNYKILPPVFDVWMRLLQRVKGSVLWLIEDNPAATTNLRAQSVKRGIAAERLVFAPRTSLAEHLARHQLADLFLDTLPYNAHTTASDALWTGVPIVTCTGRGFASRVASSLLHAVGLPELVTGDLHAYESLALELALSPGRLSAVKDKLARHHTAFPLFDLDRFRGHIERAYLTMWERHRNGLPPSAFSVPP